MQEKDTAQQVAQWMQIFRDQAQSGQTVEQWCKEHHISSKTYYRWKSIIRNQLQTQEGTAPGKGRQRPSSTAATAGSQFAELTLPEPAQEKAARSIAALPNGSQAIRIRVGGAEIKVPSGIESRHLEKVLKAVQNVW